MHMENILAHFAAAKNLLSSAMTAFGQQTSYGETLDPLVDRREAILKGLDTLEHPNAAGARQLLIDELHALNEEILADISSQRDFDVMLAPDQVEDYQKKINELSILFAEIQNDQTDFPNMPIGADMVDVFNENITGGRQEQLQSGAIQLIDKYKEDRITHREFGQILDELAANPALSDLEKAYIWDYIADNKSVPDLNLGNLSVGGNGLYEVSNAGLDPSMIDSHWGREGNTANHTIVPFTDDYHGRIGGPEGDHGVAEQEISDTEGNKFKVPGTFIPYAAANPGDEAASLATVDAFRSFRSDGFDGFAETWKERLVPLPPEPTPFPGPEAVPNPGPVNDAPVDITPPSSETSTPEPDPTPQPDRTPEPIEIPEPVVTPEPDLNAEPDHTPEPISTPEPGPTPEAVPNSGPVMTVEPTPLPDKTPTPGPATEEPPE